MVAKSKYRTRFPTNSWCVIVSRNDEPPKPAIITGVYGPWPEEIATQWALKQSDAQNAPDVHYLITPMIKDQ